MTEIKAALNDIEVRDSTKIAVLDIGSNSFHLVVARIISGTVQTLHKMKTKVRLVEGLSEGEDLSDEAIERGLDALRLFEKSLSGFHPERVRIVATYTLRKARNAHKFIKAARPILPYPVEIVSGQEEARLIYNGVAHTNTLEERTLVIDIGGGSTEFAIGDKFDPITLRSLDMGCVSFTKRFFPDGKLTSQAFNRAITAAQQELEKIEDICFRTGWEKVMGTSGSIEMLMHVASGDTPLTSYSLSHADLEQQMEDCIDKGEVANLQLGEQHEARANVYAAGLAILIAAFRSLHIKEMNFAEAALREGVIYEMDETLVHEDVRERSVQSLATRYDVDAEQANLVLATCFDLFGQVKQEWQLNKQRHKVFLGWGALLHEIGLHIHSRGVQKHSAYILQHADLHGFNAEQQVLLALLARYHRKKINLSDLPELTQYSEIEVLRCIILLRLAVLLNIKRQSGFVPELELKVDDNKIKLHFPDGWLEQHPVVFADLEAEAVYLEKVGFKLKLK